MITRTIATVSAALAALSASACAPPDDGNTVSGTDADKVTFTVTGKAPKGVDITYGSDSSNMQGKLPLKKSIKFDPDALYYHVTAQLSGGGKVKCSVTIGDKTKTGQASGGYNICSAQLNVW